jgi:hypothetical protein
MLRTTHLQLLQEADVQGTSQQQSASANDAMRRARPWEGGGLGRAGARRECAEMPLGVLAT